MKKLSTTQEEFSKVAENFLWAEATDFTVWFTGERKRWKRTEYNLPRMVEKGALKAVRHGKKLVYTVSGRRAKYKADIEHGLVCTKALLRTLASAEGEVISERFFRSMSFGAVPEWGVLYPSGTIFSFEYSSANNCRRIKLMKKKVDQYRASLESIEDYFDAKVVVLFVLDVPKHSVKSFAEKLSNNGDMFYFVDLNSFMDVEIGKQLSVPIYIYGGDGKKYPLTE